MEEQIKKSEEEINDQKSEDTSSTIHSEVGPESPSNSEEEFLSETQRVELLLELNALAGLQAAVVHKPIFAGTNRKAVLEGKEPPDLQRSIAVNLYSNDQLNAMRNRSLQIMQRLKMFS